MNFFVLVGSPMRENSITYNSFRILSEHPAVSPCDKFDFFMYKNTDCLDYDNLVARMMSADAVIFTTSPFHMGLTAQMTELFQLLEDKKLDMKNKPFSAFTTSMYLCDNFMHSNIRLHAKRLNFKYIAPLSLRSYDMVNQKLSLYSLSVPDAPPTPEEIQARRSSVPEGQKIALDWLEMLKSMITNNLQKETPKPVKALFVITNKADKPLSDRVRGEIVKMQTQFEMLDISCDTTALADYSIIPCDSCKCCYPTKHCKFKDDFEKFCSVKNAHDIIIYVGNVSGGMMGGYYKRILDREVSRGLMPSYLEPQEKYMSEAYIVDSFDSESSLYQFNEAVIATCSFHQLHFLGINSSCAESDSSEFICNYAKSIYLINGYRPQRNWYSEKIGHYFSDLSQNIPEVIPIEHDYYSRMTDNFAPIKPDLRAKSSPAPEAIVPIAQGRLTPFRMTLEGFERAKAARSKAMAAMTTMTVQNTKNNK